MSIAVYELLDDYANKHDIATGPYFLTGIESLIPSFEPTLIRPLDIGALTFQQSYGTTPERIVGGLLLPYSLILDEDRSEFLGALKEINKELGEGPWFNSQVTVRGLTRVLSSPGTYLIMGPNRYSMPICPYSLTELIETAPRALDVPRGIPRAA
jgi:hypothetical protein